ncbi:fumarylacetoacetate hydrolase family protein [Bacillus sp. JCM 19041]|uniref:fumarylacetoacetate hydrolase family protein n=1 Tax=Bacillus sp. JCM 19041 TaxID=1460637 RepID=UPI0006D0A4C4
MEIVTAHKNGKLIQDKKSIFSTSSAYDCPVTGTIYGCILNEQQSLNKKLDSFSEKPYQTPPKAPILYLKPENTKNGHQSQVAVPEKATKVSIGGTLGIIIGKTATQVSVEKALDFIGGYTIVSDVSLPHDSFFRPAVKYRSLDGFTPAGPWIVSKETIADPNKLNIRTKINDDTVLHFNTGNLVRSVEQLLSDITEFMTLCPGDCLLVGNGLDLPLAGVGDHIEVHIDEIGFLQHSISLEKKGDSL